jgi:hypothetical protein
MIMSKLKDSGTRKRYSTGAMKDKGEGIEANGGFQLVPPWPIRELAEHYRKGAEKYHARNWELGLPLSDYLGSAEGHLNQFHMGMIDEPHLTAAIWNLVSLSHTMKMIELGILPEDLNDLPSYGPPGDPDYRPEGPGFIKQREELIRIAKEKAKKEKAKKK